MNNSKQILAALGAAFVSLLLVSCGGGGDGPSGTTNPLVGTGATNPSVTPYPISPSAAPATTCDINGGSAQAYTAVGEFKVYRGDCVMSLSLSSAEWSTLLSSPGGRFDKQKYDQLFASRFKDAFDFVVFALDTPAVPAGFGYVGYYSTANNRYPVRKARLLGTMVLANVRGQNPIKGGPMLHEFMHEWGNLGLLPSPGDSSHWGFSSAGGQLGGFQNGTLVQLSADTWRATGPATTCLPDATAQALARCQPPSSFGTFANGGNRIAYSQLELFSMGLVEASTVPATRVAKDGQWIDAANGIFKATNWDTFSAEQVFANAAGKIPASAGGQKHFRMATVVLTPNNVLDADLLIDLNSTLAGFTGDSVPSYGVVEGLLFNQNFYTATKGLATMRAGKLLSEAK